MSWQEKALAVTRELGGQGSGAVFHREGWTMATNRHRVIFIKGIHGEEKTRGVTLTADQVWDIRKDPKDYEKHDSIDWFAFRKWAEIEVALTPICPTCEGDTEKPEKIDCEECRGRGACFHCGSECEVCEGQRFITCLDHSLVRFLPLIADNPGRCGAIGGANIDRFLLWEAFQLLPGPHAVHSSDNSADPVWITGDDWEFGIIGVTDTVPLGKRFELPGPKVAP